MTTAVKQDLMHRVVRDTQVVQWSTERWTGHGWRDAIITCRKTFLAPWAEMSTSDGSNNTVLFIDRIGGGDRFQVDLGYIGGIMPHLKAAVAIIDLMERKGFAGSQSDWLRLTEADIRYAIATVLT